MAIGSLGALVISLTAETAQFNSAMTKAAYTANKELGNIAKDASSASKAISGINASLESVGLGFRTLLGLAAGGGFLMMVKGAIDSQASMHDLALTVGTSVEQLSSLVPAAKLSGQSMDDVGKIALKLSKSLTEAQDGTSKAALTMKALGFSEQDVARMARDPVNAMIEIAKRTKEFTQDGAIGAATMELFGKRAEEVGKFMTELANQQQFAATMTQEQTDAAKLAEEQMLALQLNTEATSRAFANAMVPAITDVLQGFNDLAAKKDGTTSFFSVLDTLVRAAGISVITLWTGLKDIGTTLGALIASYVSVATGNLSAVGTIWKEHNKDIEKNNDEMLDAWATMLGEVTGKENAQTAAEKAHTGARGDLNLAFGKTKAAIDPGLQAAVDFENNLMKQIATFGLSEEAMLKYQARQKGLGDADDAMIKQLIILKMNQADFDEEIKKSTDDMKKLGDAMTAEKQAAIDTNAEWLHAIDDLKFETSLMSLNTAERERAILMRKLEKDAVHLTADEYQRYKDAINAAVDDKAATQSMIDSANESAQAWKQAANTIENDLISAFENGVKTGASLFTDLKNLAIKLFSQLILRPMLQPLSNSMASMFGGGGGAGGSMNLLGEGFSLANNTWGGAAGGMGPPNPNAMFGTSGMSETYGGYAAGAMGGAAAGYGIGTVAGQLFGNSRNQQSMQMGATIGGAVGSIWGPIGSLVGSMIGSAVGSLIKDGGGAKVGGSATTGGTWSTQLMEGGRYFTPNDADADLKKAVKVSSDSYSGLYKLLGGGGLTSAQFAMGYDTDPKGTAPNRARAGVIVNGRQVYQSNQEDLGTDPARLTAALALEAQRSILAALQASDLPADIAALLNSVNAATASQDTISGLEQFASAMQNIDTLMSSNLGDEATKYLKAQNATAMDSFHGTATALRDLLTAADYSTAGVDALTAATNDYYRSAVILLAQIEQVKQSISNMFGDTIRSMTLQTLDKPGQYDYLMNEAGDLQAQMLASNDPAQIAALAQKINDDLNAAFGLLTPEQQQEYLGQFTQNITDLNTTVEDKLNEIRDNVTTAVGDTLTEASNNLSLAADKFTTAANTADNAANTNLAAANTPLQVDVTTHDGAPAEVNVSGG